MQLAASKPSTKHALGRFFVFLVGVYTMLVLMTAAPSLSSWGITHWEGQPEGTGPPLLMRRERRRQAAPAAAAPGAEPTAQTEEEDPLRYW